MVAYINSPSYKLANHIAQLISHFKGSTDSYVKNSRHFVETMTEFKLCPDELLVSFELCSLFTKVPIQKPVETIRRRLQEGDTLEERTALQPDSIAELLELCLKSTYFCFKDKFNDQWQGAAMGSPILAIVADLYMEHFEELALRFAPQPPKLWKW